MSELSPTKETSLEPLVETVRCIVENPKGQILLLQKSKDSKAPELFEFPGGKIEGIHGETSTEDEQKAAVLTEIPEETDLDISDLAPKKINEFDYIFSAKGNQYQRRVHMYYVKLKSNDPVIRVNTTQNSEGLSEDNHALFVWKTRDELVQMKNKGILSGNSQHFEGALGINF